jgi:hypothetical protein
MTEQPTPNPAVPPHPLLWQETKDSRGNSTFTALSQTWGDDAGNPAFAWRLACVLRNNTAVVTLDGTDNELVDGHDGTIPAFDIGTHGIEFAKAWCQAREDELRAKLGEGLPPPPAPEPDTPPAVLAEDGFAPTHQVRVRWSPNGGVLRVYRVWKQPDSELEQEREITEQPELDVAIGQFFTQKFVEELVTRLVTGGFGRMDYETPFANVFMQVELDFLAVSSFTVRLIGKQGRDIAVPVPTTDRIMRVVARQMAERKRRMDEAIGDIDIRTLHSEIERNARALGIPYHRPSGAPAEAESGIVPVALEDVLRGGGDITDMGQKRNGGAK